MAATHRENEDDGSVERVPEGAIRGINDIVEGRLATKEDLADVLKF